MYKVKSSPSCCAVWCQMVCFGTQNVSVLCPRGLERKLRGGIRTRWKAVPLHGAQNIVRYHRPCHDLLFARDPILKQHGNKELTRAVMFYMELTYALLATVCVHFDRSWTQAVTSFSPPTPRPDVHNVTPTVGLGPNRQIFLLRPELSW